MRLGTWVGGIVDGFIPEAVRERGDEVVRRTRAVIWLTFTLTLVGVVGMVEMGARGAHQLMAVLAVMTTVALLCPFLLKRTGNVLLVGSLMLSFLFVGVVMLTWRAGGLGAPALYALALAPFLATLGVRRNASLFWGAVSVVIVIAFSLLNAADMVPPTSVEPSALMRGHTIVLLLVIVITIGGVRVYERLREEELIRLKVAQQQAEEARRQAEEARKEAEAANRAKRDFLANVSHEIRTPMTGVMTASAMLVSMPLEESARELVEIIHKSADALLVVMDDMLDFARLEEGRVKLSESSFDVTALVHSVAKLMAPDAQNRGLTLRSAFSEEQASMVVGDEARVRQILVNLVSNAIKFTDEGSVEVRLAIESEDDQAQVRIEVIDTGIGMTQQDLQRVFQRFERVEEEGAPRRHGTGLGLAISRQLAELMGGTLQAASIRGQGSRFTLHLPLPVAVMEAQPQSSLNELGSFNAKVLLAEDNPINRRICSMLLERLGCEVHLARNGRKAVEKATAESYDIILMDCYMPEMDGLMATQKLRVRGGELTDIPIIAFTASGTDRDRQACIEAGMDDVVTKPVQLVQLSAMLRRWVGDKPPAPKGAVDHVA